MFSNLGLHVIKNPAGTYSYVGSIPYVLGTVVKADRAAVLGNRTLNERAANGDIQMIKFPVFQTEAEAVAHAASRGHTVRIPA
jgi:hypothetical protein